MTLDRIPVLHTDRLVLRAFGEPDLDGYSAIVGDERVAAWLGGKPLSRDDAWRSIATHLGHWLLRGYGQWALEDKTTGRLVGRAGLWRPEGWPGLEVGWTVAPDHWGRGYATEAGRAALRWAFEDLGVDEVLSVTLPHNVASRRVMEKLGLTHDRDEHIIGFDQVVYRITRERWGAHG